MIRIFTYTFSVISKVKKVDRIKKGLIKPTLYPYLYKDYVGSISYQQMKDNLSPYQQFLIETRSMQRPYTGMLWGQLQVGFYHCCVCNTRLFSFDQKFDCKSGHPTFFTYIEDRVKVLENDNKQEISIQKVNYPRIKSTKLDEKYKVCHCSICQSFIGLLYFDGQPPTFKRYTINSALLKFIQFEDFPDPNINDKKRRLKYEMSKIQYI